MSGATSGAAPGAAPGATRATRATFTRYTPDNVFEPSPYESKVSYSLQNENILEYNESDPPLATDRKICIP